MSELVEFLRARLAEDAAAAEAARRQVAERACPPVEAADWVERAGRWKAVPWLFTGRAEAELERWGRVEIATLANDHIARHDPARVLAEVEAKRKILVAFEAAATETVRTSVGVDAQDGLISGLTEAVKRLASVYASHPDYREEWKP